MMFINNSSYCFALENKFSVIMLGTKGGLVENDLSCYLVAKYGDNNFVALDAGTLASGLRLKKTVNILKQLGINAKQNIAQYFLQHHIKAYLISHAHLDHISGLVLNSTDDNPKMIMATSATITNLKDNIFNWKIWPNFSDTGTQPLKKYHYITMQYAKNYDIANTGLSVVAYPLNHGNSCPSTAFLLNNDNFYLLYVGDTGSDQIQKDNKLKHLWQTIAPLIITRKLRVIFIECSYPNSQPEKMLYGHLSPQWFILEMQDLLQAVKKIDPKGVLTGLKVVVTHRKYTDIETLNKIATELELNNNLGIKLIFPEQGTLENF